MAREARIARRVFATMSTLGFRAFFVELTLAQAANAHRPRRCARHDRLALYRVGDAGLMRKPGKDHSDTLSEEMMARRPVSAADLSWERAHATMLQSGSGVRRMNR